MKPDSYTRTFIVPCDPQVVFKAVTEDFDRWWSASSAPLSSVGDESTVTFEPSPAFWRFRVLKLVPDRLVELECVQANHVQEEAPDNIREEWLGTRLVWELEPHDLGTKVIFHHHGLVPELNCYETCEAGWDYFLLGSLSRYLNSGVGHPVGAEAAR